MPRRCHYCGRAIDGEPVWEKAPVCVSRRPFGEVRLELRPFHRACLHAYRRRLKIVRAAAVCAAVAAFSASFVFLPPLSPWHGNLLRALLLGAAAYIMTSELLWRWLVLSPMRERLLFIDEQGAS